MASVMQQSGKSSNSCNHDVCQTQQFYDRDLELIRCEENRQCEFKRYYNKMTICTCPSNN